MSGARDVNGAHALVRSLVDAGVDVCFANPGTSEMHFVAALDDVPQMRAVLTLFEGVASGAADGWARMTGRPAATLLHLGPGMGNGWRTCTTRGAPRTPLVNVVGDHATTHKRHDAPLESDIDALAGTVSSWVRRSLSTRDLAADAMDALAAACGPPGGVATLDPARRRVLGRGRPTRRRRPDGAGRRSCTRTRSPRWGRCWTGRAQPCCSSAATRSPSAACWQRPAWRRAPAPACCARPSPPGSPAARACPRSRPLPYPPEPALEALAGTSHLVLAGAREPVAFFAYPGLPGTFAPADCAVHPLAEPGQDATAALEALAELVAPDTEPVLSSAGAPRPPPRPAHAADARGRARRPAARARRSSSTRR